MYVLLGILGWLGLAVAGTIGWARFQRRVSKPPIPDGAARHQPAA